MAKISDGAESGETRRVGFACRLIPEQRVSLSTKKKLPAAEGKGFQREEKGQTSMARGQSRNNPRAEKKIRGISDPVKGENKKKYNAGR